MKTLVLLVIVVVAPAAASAQPAIAGLVKDASGTPLPGVTVTAASPALIEKIRTAPTDSAGRYRIEDLRPGVYEVRFAHPAWRPHLQAGVTLTGTATTTVDAQLDSASLSETITVTADALVLDVHSARREVTLSGELAASLPTVRSYNALLVLVPGIVTSSNDTVTGTATTAFPVHGGRTNEGRLTLDGLNVGSPPSGNGPTSYVVDVGHAQEVTFATAGGLGEVETAGLVMNIVPRSGGNTLRGSFFASGSGAALQSDNLTGELKAQGLTAATPLSGVYDFSAAVGGPISKDRLWDFVNAGASGSTRTVPNVYYNRNAGDPSKWLYSPDATRHEYSDRTFENVSGRATWQVTPRHKVGGFWDAQTICRTCTGATPGAAEPSRVSPEAVGVLGRRLDVFQATWSSPVSDRLLLDAGFGGTYFGVGNFERAPNPTRALIRVAEQCPGGCAANGNIPGLVYRSQDFSVAHTGSYLWRGSLSYVTGTHQLKVGYQHTLMTDDRTWMTNDQNLTYRVANGVPNQLTQSISPWVNSARVEWQGVFVQEQWTLQRLTLHGALRFDRARSWFPRQQEGPSRFLPTPLVIPETRGVDSYKDVTPRMAVVYDVSGSGRTALKASVGRYLEGAGVTGTYANSNPTLRMPQTTMTFGTAGVTRAWTDSNGNFVPDCDLHNAAAQDLRAAGGDLCGVLSDTNFGKAVFTSRFDPQILQGWGVRPFDWSLDIAIDHQLLPRVALQATYSRRAFSGFSVVDNLALQPSDFTPFELVAPSDPRLPGGGGYVVSGLSDVVPERFGQVDNLVADSRGYGRWSQRYDGLDLIVKVRTPQLTIVGGTSTGQTIADNCGVRGQLPELSTSTTGTSAFGAGLAGSAVTPLSPYCHVPFGILTQFRGLASYLVPRIGVQVSATFQSKPGPMLAANYAAPNSAVAPSLGRNLSGNAANVTVNLVPPGTMYGDRINALDFRVAKILRLGRARSTVAADVFNALNSSAVLSYNNAYVPGGTWLQPLSILTPRFVKIAWMLDF